ncbi:MAG: hypothetical protein KIT80_05820 [Chitinophagaceae bacterium]|nr:hypothetical protein [Chitinophagaceae bacterium]MCW5926410.1 hypothetical protein [Chitinophagaceae bacterium]
MNQYRSLFIAVLLLGSQPLFAQHSLYDMYFRSSTDNLIHLSDYKGKKLLIAIANTATVQDKNSSAGYMGAIRKNYPDIAVLVIPLRDSADTAAVDLSRENPLKSSNTNYSSLIAFEERAQHPLLQWLTQAGRNKHFDKGITSDEQFFVISESGVLYAVLEKGVPDAFLKAVLTAPDVQPQQVITDHNRQGYTPSE